MEIVLKNVTYRYHQKTLLEKINLKIEGPKVVGVMGTNKTQLLKLIDAINIPTKGTLQIGSDTLNKDNLQKIRRKVSLVTQDIKDQFFENTLNKEIDFLIQNLNSPTINLKKRILDSLKIVNLNDSYLDKKIIELSSGEKKLVQLAISLIYNPKVILLDEPFQDLDYQKKRKLIRLIKMLKEKYNKIIIIASNDSNLLYPLVDELIILEGSKLVEHKPATELFQDKTILTKYNIDTPYLVEFTNKAKEKNIKLSYHKDIRDIIKDIYKHV